MGSWITLLGHEDQLPAHALFCVVDAINKHPYAKLIYSDEDRIDHAGRRESPYFKPDWNRDLFLSQNLIGHLGVYRTALVRELGGFRSEFDGSHDYDLALRYSEQLEPSEIHHIPNVLYHSRAAPESTEKACAQHVAGRAVGEYLERRGIPARVEIDDIGYRVRYELPSPAPRVTLIIPTHNGHALLDRCISSIRTLTAYPQYDILVIDNGSDDGRSQAYLLALESAGHARVLRDARPFNYSALNNAAVDAARGPIVCLLNNDTEVITPDWLDEMVALACQPGVGAVGARLWYPDDRLQHAGVVLGVAGIAGHAWRHLPRSQLATSSRANLLQSYAAVTAACLVVRKDLYLRAGGLNERDLAVAFNDVDFCLKLRELGYRNVWTPHANLYHHEWASRGPEELD